MKTRSRRICAYMLFCIVLPALLCSCGRKTIPLTPDSPRPEAITALKAIARDNVAFLSWPIPTRNVEMKEMPVTAIEGFRIYRATLEPGKKKARFRQVAEIKLSGPAPAEVRSGVVYWSDKDLKYGFVYAYKVRAESMEGGLSPFSNEVRSVPLLSLAPPNNVTAVGGDSNNLITWDPVTKRMDGSRYEGFVGYNVYRRTEAGRYDETPLNKEPLRKPSYTDAAVVIDKSYFYQVRSVDSPTPPWKESLDSSEVTATPRKLTPPARPAGLTVVPGVGRIFLTWNENSERDIAGYHVYRKRNGAKYERLTEQPVKRTTYSDETAEAGAIYHYMITAVDKYGNESQPSKEQESRAERIR